jgi:hypothetical protein
MNLRLVVVAIALVTAEATLSGCRGSCQSTAFGAAIQRDLVEMISDDPFCGPDQKCLKAVTCQAQHLRFI